MAFRTTNPFISDDVGEFNNSYGVIVDYLIRLTTVPVERRQFNDVRGSTSGSTFLKTWHVWDSLKTPSVQQCGCV